MKKPSSVNHGGGLYYLVGDYMKKKLILKIAWVGITCLAVLASCVRMESNTMRVYAEDTTEPVADEVYEDWEFYSSTLLTLIGSWVSIPSSVNGASLGVQIALANTIPLATAGDITVFDNVAEIVGTYDYIGESGATTTHICHIGGSKTKYYSELVQAKILTYPSGSSAYIIPSTDSYIYADPTPNQINILASSPATYGYTEPNAVINSGNYTPFAVYYYPAGSKPLSKNYANTYSPDVLCKYLYGAFGSNVYTLSDGYGNATSDTTFVFPNSSSSGVNTVNEYLQVVYDEYEEQFSTPFEYLYPDLVPVGTLMPDGTIKEDPEQTTDEDGNIIVNVEFPTHLVPDVPEPDIYDYSQIQQVEIPLADEGVIKATWISGFSALVETMVYTMDAFHLRELVLLLCVVGIFVYLIVRY